MSALKKSSAIKSSAIFSVIFSMWLSELSHLTVTFVDFLQDANDYFES